MGNNYVLAGATMIRRFLDLLRTPVVPSCPCVVGFAVAVSRSPHGSHARTTDVRRLSAKPPTILAIVLALSSRNKTLEVVF